mgnify:CR=1 FL=1
MSSMKQEWSQQGGGREIRGVVVFVCHEEDGIRKRRRNGVRAGARRGDLKTYTSWIIKRDIALGGGGTGDLKTNGTASIRGRVAFSVGARLFRKKNDTSLRRHRSGVPVARSRG